MIKLRHITKTYHQTPVLQDVSLNLGAGKCYGLLGNNGAGKSTLMRIVMRAEIAETGEGEVMGIPLTEDGAQSNSQIGFVSEDIQYFVTQSLRRFLPIYRSFYPDWDQETFDRLSESFGLEMDKSPHQCSRGQRMQIAFVLAASIRPKLILVDEVTSVLDPHVRCQVIDWLKSFRESGGTILMATNIVSEVNDLADEFIVLHEGRVVLQGSQEMIEQNFEKLRQKPEEHHKVFEHPQCLAVGSNSDGSRSFLLPKEVEEELKVPKKLHDRRPTTVEEVFLYQTQRRKKAA